MPHWFAVLTFAALASIPWLTWSWRFNLRALLIVTALVAIVLALVVYTVRYRATSRAEQRGIERRAAAKQLFISD
jgi:hydrogenase-4 membrane subunit HyfE